jgi:hypothetical protein
MKRKSLLEARRREFILKYNTPMNLKIHPRLKPKKDPFFTANLISFSTNDCISLYIPKSIPYGDFIRALCSNRNITEEEKNEKIKSQSRNLAKQMHIIWNRLRQGSPKIDKSARVSPSYCVKIYKDVGKPSCFLEDIHARDKLVTNSDYVTYVGKRRSFLKEFRHTTPGIESMSFFDTYISIIETIYRGLLETGFDIFYDNQSITYIFDIIYPVHGPLILGICKIYREETYEWLLASLRKALINYQIAKKMVFSPYMTRPDINPKRSNYKYHIDGLSNFKVVTTYAMPIDFPVDNVTFIARVVDIFIMKCRYKKIVVEAPVVLKMNQTARNIIRALRSFREQSFQVNGKLASVFVAASLLCVSLVDIRSLSMKEGEVDLQKSIGVIDSALSGPDKILAVIIDNLFIEDKGGIAETINYFKKVDFDQVLAIYKRVCLFINTLFDLSSDPSSESEPNVLLVTVNNGTLSISDLRSTQLDEFDFENEEWQRNLDMPLQIPEGEVTKQ